MTNIKFLAKQDTNRKKILSGIHKIIIETDKNVKAEDGKMMGKEMILYKTDGIFKYGLSSVNQYMSLHLMPIYGSSKLHSKYENLLKQAKFQKGCINFRNEEEMPLEIVKHLISDCSKIDMKVLMQNWKRL